MVRTRYPRGIYRVFPVSRTYGAYIPSYVQLSNVSIENLNNPLGLLRRVKLLLYYSSAHKEGVRLGITWVGMMWVISSSESFLRIVVLPALSKPKTKIRASWSLLFSLRSNVKSPILLPWRLRLSNGARLHVGKTAASWSPYSGRVPQRRGVAVLLVFLLSHRTDNRTAVVDLSPKDSSGWLSCLDEVCKAADDEGISPRPNKLSRV